MSCKPQALSETVEDIDCRNGRLAVCVYTHFVSNLLRAAGAPDGDSYFFPKARIFKSVDHVFDVVHRGGQEYRKSEQTGTIFGDPADDCIRRHIHAQEDLEAARAKSKAVVEKLEEMRLGKAAKIVQEGAEETLSYMAFPREHWLRIRTNNPLERILKEVRRRTRVVGAFPDGQSALMLVAARLRHIAGTRWGTKAYLNMKRLEEAQTSLAVAG